MKVPAFVRDGGLRREVETAPLRLTFPPLASPELVEGLPTGQGAVGDAAQNAVLGEGARLLGYHPMLRETPLLLPQLASRLQTRFLPVNPQDGWGSSFGTG